MEQTFSSEAKRTSFFFNSIPVRRFSVEEYHYLGEIGIIDEDERVELIDGRILKMSPIGSRHAAYVSLLNRKLRQLEDRTIVRIQDPVILDDETEPQLDIAVVKFKENSYIDSHPHSEDVLLIIEVSETSLEKDREIKLPHYAISGIQEVWIVNLIENLVEVYRELLILANGIGGYCKRTNFETGEFISPIAFPDFEIEIPRLSKFEE